MKANLLFALVLACTTNFCFGQWTQQLTPTTANLKAVSFYNNRIGFAVGDKGTVLRTRNGGQHWDLLKFPVSDNLTSVVLLDSGIVIVTTTSDVANAAVYRSSDAGASWQSVLNDTRTFYAAKTPAKRLFSFSDHIYESRSTGKSWTSSEDLNNTTTYDFIDFKDEQHGMIGGNVSGIVTYSAEFIRSEDGGKTWYNSFPYDFPNANAFSTMSSINADTVFMFTNYYNRYQPGDSSQLVVLTNFHLRRGLSDLEWHFTSKVVNNSFPDRLYASKFFDNGIAYTGGEKGIIYRSPNYGKRWVSDYGGKSPINGFYMFNEHTGYAVGNGGLVLKRDTIAKAAGAKQDVVLKLFPNPANDQAMLSFILDQPIKMHVRITDAGGNIVLTQAAKSFGKGAHQISLPVSALQRGVYQVNLLSDKQIIAHARLVIVR